MPTFRWSDLEKEVVEPEYSSATGSVFRGEKIEVRLARYPARTEVKPHASPHEQVQSILKGKAKYRVGGEEKVVGPGEAVLIRPNTEHAVQVLEEMEVVSFRDVRPAARAEQEGAPGLVFFTWAEMKSGFITPKYSTGQGATITGQRIEVAFMSYPGGTGGKPHSHPNEQIQVAIKGRAKYTIGGEEFTTEPGAGGVLMPSNVEHDALALDDYTVINCKDIVPGWSVYHARWEK